MPEKKDDVKIQIQTEGKTLANCPDLEKWSLQEVSKRITALVEEGFSFQSKQLKAERELSKAVENLNKEINSENSEDAARAVFTVSEKKKAISEIKTAWKKNTAERITLERHSRAVNDRRYDTGPETILADGSMRRIY